MRKLTFRFHRPRAAMCPYVAGVREIDWAQGVVYTYREHYENIGAVSKERKSRSNWGQSTVFANIRINCALTPAFPVNNSRGWYEHQS